MPNSGPTTAWPYVPGEMATLIRAFDWSRTPLGGIDTWTERCRNVVDMVLASGFPTIALIGRELVQIYNAGYRDLMGEKHPGGLGQPTRECWPEVWHLNAPIYDRVWAGETVTLQDALYPIVRDGALQDAWFTLSYGPLRDRDGTVADILVTVIETTERVRSQNALADSETRFRAFVSASSDVVYRMGPDWAEMRQLDGRGFLSDTTDPDETWLSRYIHPDDQPTVQAAIEHAIRSKSTFELEHRVIRADGSLGWTASRAVPILDGVGGIVEWLGTASDVTERKAAQQALRASEERQAFLLKLSDALRPIHDPVEMQSEAARLLGEHLDAGGCNYVEVDAEAGDWVIHRDYRRDGFPSIAGRFRREEWPLFGEDFLRGELMSIPDIGEYPLISPEERAATEALGLVAMIIAPITKRGRFLGGMAVTDTKARAWTPDDMALVVEVAERTWAAVERARVEAALTESEALFRSFAENSTDTLWIVDAATGRIDYLSPAFAAMYGEAPDRVMADLARFLDLVHPDDRERVAQAMPKLLASDATNQVEYRIRRPSDGSVRWVQDTGFPIRGKSGRVERAGGIVQDVTDRREAEETLRDSEAGLQVMVAELHHRTRNLIGVVGTIMRQMVASSGSLEDFRTRFTQRLEALSRAQSLLSRKAEGEVTIADIVRVELEALGADLAGDRVRIEGEAVPLKRSAVQTLALAIHELATNARKYGALHADEGILAVRWNVYADEKGKQRFRFEWTETGIDVIVEKTKGPMHRGGYGRELIENALPYTLKAKTTYTLGRDRLDCTVDMPLEG